MTPNEAALTKALQPLVEYLNPAATREWHELGARLERVIEAAVPVLGVHSVGLMLIDEADCPRVAGVSDELGLVLESAQTNSGEGPGLDSLRTGATVTVVDLAADGRYPGMWQRVGPHELRAVVSSPVRVGDAVVGNFNAAVCHPHAWSAEQVRANDTYAHLIGLALSMTAQATGAQTRVSRLRDRLAFSGHLADEEDYR